MHKTVRFVSTRANLLRFFRKVKQFSTENFPISETVAASTFAQRFEFSRDRQRSLGTWQDDQTLAEIIGVSGSQVTDYKSRKEAPPAPRTLRLAKAMGIDPGWLAFGDASKAPEPDGFRVWLSNRGAARPMKAATGLPKAAPSSRDRAKRKAR